MNAEDFKAALSRWATGVAVVTTIDGSGAGVGLTVTSFSSLSLDPPLVLFCLGRESGSYAAFQQAPGFAVHLMAAEQQGLCGRFAGPAEDRFAGLACRTGRWGVPVLEGCLVVLECRLQERIPGGDHVIVVGEVLEVSAEPAADNDPLLYFRGGYRILSA